MGEFFHIVYHQIGHVFHHFHQQHAAFAHLPHRAFHFWVAFVADHDDLVAVFIEALHLFVHLGHQWTSGVKNAEAAAYRFFLHRQRHAVCRINQG